MTIDAKFLIIMHIIISVISSAQGVFEVFVLLFMVILWKRVYSFKRGTCQGNIIILTRNEKTMENKIIMCQDVKLSHSRKG